MPALPLAVRPGEPEGLRGQRDDSGVEVQRHRRVPLHPGLIAHLGPRSRRPILTGEVLLPLERGERPDRRGELERLGPAACQWPGMLDTVGVDEPDFDA